ncbi:MAG: hypothetical protein GY705_07465, partial [Bacteroidetes bacterium]|nr:hypothetical protein [Bacteroidota bacterium]
QGNTSTNLKHEYCTARRAFNRSLRSAKRKYQKEEELQLLQMCSSNSVHFWKKVKSIGIAGERKSFLPNQVKDENGNLITKQAESLEEWKKCFEKIYSDSGNNTIFDDNHLSDLIEANKAPPKTNQNQPLNKEISEKEVKEAMLRAKLRKAAGVDGIRAEILKNNTCIKLFHKLFNHCFKLGQVPSCWNKGIITPIPKDSSKDPQLPSNYRGIAIYQYLVRSTVTFLTEGYLHG